MMKIFYQLRKKKCSLNFKLNMEDQRSFIANQAMKKKKEKINKWKINNYSREWQTFWKTIKCVKNNINKK